MHDLLNKDVYVYLRKSRELELNPEETLSRHKNTLLEYAIQKQMNVVHIYEEILSGESLNNRPEIIKMLKNVEKGMVKGVLVMDIDRLTRGGLVDAGTIYRIFRDTETLIVTPSQIYDCEEDGSEIIFGIKTLFAREELRKITERQKNGKLRASKEGKEVGCPPLGYQIGPSGKLVVDVNEIKVVRLIFELAASGMSRIAIATKLNQSGIKPRRGREWYASTVFRLVSNEKYLGKMIYGKTENKMRNNRRLVKKNNPDQWIRIENTHEPIICRELFEKANENIKRFSVIHEKKHSVANPLAGLIRCGICNRFIQLMCDKKSKNKHMRCISYSCKQVQRGILLKQMEVKILESLESITKELTLDSSTFDGEFEKEQIRTLSIILTQLTKELRELNELRDEACMKVEKGIYTVDEFFERNNFISERIKIVEEKRTGTLEQIDNLNQRKEKLRKLPSIVETYRTLTDPWEKQQLLKSVVKEIIYIRKKDWIIKDQFEITIKLNFAV